MGIKPKNQTHISRVKLTSKFDCPAMEILRVTSDPQVLKLVNLEISTRRNTQFVLSQPHMYYTFYVYEREIMIAQRYVLS